MFFAVMTKSKQPCADYTDAILRNVKYKVYPITAEATDFLESFIYVTIIYAGVNFNTSWQHSKVKGLFAFTYPKLTVDVT